MSSYSFYDLRQTSRKIQNAISGYTELENLIREVTNTDQWGPTTQQLKELKDYLMTPTSANSISNEGRFELTDEDDIYNRSRYDDNDDNDDDYDYTKGVDPRIDTRTMSHVSDFLISRLKEYSGVSNTFGTSLTGSGRILKDIKKKVLTGGYEFIIVSKCISVLEFLVLNCYTTSNNNKDNKNTFDFKDELRYQLNYLKLLKNNYKCLKSYDNLNMQHEKVVHEKTSHLLDLIQDSQLLSNERSKLAKTMKNIRKHSSNLSVSSSSSSFYDPNDTFTNGNNNSALNRQRSDSKLSVSNLLPNDIIRRMTSVSLNSPVSGANILPRRRTSSITLDTSEVDNINSFHTYDNDDYDDENYEFSDHRRNSNSLPSQTKHFSESYNDFQFTEYQKSPNVSSYHDRKNLGGTLQNLPEVKETINDNADIAGDDDDDDDEFGEFTTSSYNASAANVASNITSSSNLMDLMSSDSFAAPPSIPSVSKLASPIHTSSSSNYKTMTSGGSGGAVNTMNAPSIQFKSIPKSTSTNSLGSPIQFKSNDNHTTPTASSSSATMKSPKAKTDLFDELLSDFKVKSK